MSRRVLLILWTAVAALAVSAIPAQAACECGGEVDLESAYAVSEHVVAVRVTSGVIVSGSRFYRGDVVEVYKGDLERGVMVYIEAPMAGDTCAASLAMKTISIVTADALAGPPSPLLGIDGCGYNVPKASLTAAELAFLEDPTVVDPPVVDPPDDDGCPDEHFLDVSQSEGPGAGYPDPELSVTCTDDELVVASNGMPNYTFVAMTPNALTEQDHQWTIPLQPEIADSVTEIPLLGTVGFAVNGLPFYGPNEAAFPDPYGDPVYNGIMDDCLGHTGGTGDYHYHAMLVACLSGDVPEGEPSPIVGFALDGFPIYGPMVCVDAACTQMVELQSAWETLGDPTTYAWDANEYVEKADAVYLDECNGHVGPNGDYHYHATNSFPYLLGCYTGTPSADAGGGDPTGGGGGPPGGGPGGGGPPGP